MKNNNKKPGFGIIQATIISSMISIGAQALPAPAVSAAEPINQIVAVVNEDIITQDEVNHILQGMHADPAIFKEKIIQSLIDQKLQLELAKQNNITTSPEQVTRAIQQIADHNHVSIEMLQNKLAEDGIAFTQFQQQVNDQLTLLNLQQKAIAGKVSITDDEVKAFVTKNNVAPLEAKQQLYQEKFQATLKTWLESLKSTAYIKIYASKE